MCKCKKMRDSHDIRTRDEHEVTDGLLEETTDDEALLETNDEGMPRLIISNQQSTRDALNATVGGDEDEEGKEDTTEESSLPSPTSLQNVLVVYVDCAALITNEEPAYQLQNQNAAMNIVVHTDNMIDRFVSAARLISNYAEEEEEENGSDTNSDEVD